METMCRDVQHYLYGFAAGKLYRVMFGMENDANNMKISADNLCKGPETSPPSGQAASHLRLCIGNAHFFEGPMDPFYAFLVYFFGPDYEGRFQGDLAAVQTPDVFCHKSLAFTEDHFEEMCDFRQLDLSLLAEKLLFVFCAREAILCKKVSVPNVLPTQVDSLHASSPEQASSETERRPTVGPAHEEDQNRLKVAIFAAIATRSGLGAEEYERHSLKASLFQIGGIASVLTLLARQWDVGRLHVGMEFLFHCTLRDAVNSSDFHSILGHDILAQVLRRLGSKLTIGMCRNTSLLSGGSMMHCGLTFVPPRACSTQDTVSRVWLLSGLLTNGVVSDWRVISALILDYSIWRKVCFCMWCVWCKIMCALVDFSSGDAYPYHRNAASLLQ